MVQEDLYPGMMVIAAQWQQAWWALVECLLYNPEELGTAMRTLAECLSGENRFQEWRSFGQW